MNTSQQQGNLAEQQALSYLINAGLTPIRQNYHSKRGEIDLIMADGDSLVFIEVRYRKSDRFGSAIESVNAQKQQRIIQTAEYFLLQNATKYRNYRFDVVAISPTGNETSISWIKDAFQLN